MRMMRVVSLAVTLGIGVLGTVSAQSPFTFGLGGGVLVPLGKRDYGLLLPGTNMRWQGLGLLQFRPFGDQLGFQLDGTYQPADAFTGGVAGGQRFNSTANIVWEFGRARTTKVVPYIIGGAGVYSFQHRGVDASSMHFGLNAGAGLNLRLGLGSLFVESRFHNVFNAGRNADGSAHLLPITAGFKITGP